MSKKESEFERYDRMKRLEKEAKLEIRKNADTFLEEERKKKGKPKDIGKGTRNVRTLSYIEDMNMDAEF